MRAVVADGNGGVHTVEAAMPRVIRDTDAILRVTCAAICGTDLGLLRTPGALPRGTRIGHEFVGIVESVGAHVLSIRKGMRVFVSDYTACGTCWWCQRGHHWECEHRQFFGTGDAFGPTLPGGQSQFVRIPFADTVLFPLEDSISDEAGVFLGDLIPTGWAALHRAGMKPGESVVISGGGPVGQVASLVAQAIGAGPVIVSEPDAARRELAARNGAAAVRPEEARDVVNEASNGRGADIVIDCVGGQSGLDSAVSLVRARGRIASVGVPHSDLWQSPIRDLFARQIDLSFVVGDSIRDRNAFVPLVASGLLDPTVVITSAVGLEQAAEGYAAASSMADVKVLIRL
jgi:alcohol dehydrogenase